MALDSKEWKFKDLEKEYQSFYAPAFEITIGGKNLVKDIGMAITGVTVETSIKAADTLAFDVRNAFDIKNREFMWLDDYLTPGKIVEVKFGYSSNVETIFKGFIKSTKFHFPQGENPKVDVTAMDFSFLMTKGNDFRFWEKKKYSDVVDTIASKYTTYIKTKKIDSTDIEIDKIIQNGMSDFKFLQMIADRVNYEFFVTEDVLYFRKPLGDETPVTTLTWGENLQDFGPDIDIGDQIPEVIVRAWNELKDEEVESKSKSITKLGSNSQTGQEIWKKLLGDTAKEHIYSQTASSKSDAEAEATAHAGRQSMKLITGSCACIGIPKIRAGRYIKLDKVGEKFSSTYYIASATHTIGSSGYATNFNIEGNAI